MTTSTESNQIAVEKCHIKKLVSGYDEVEPSSLVKFQLGDMDSAFEEG